MVRPALLSIEGIVVGARLALCNEVVAGLDFARQCAFAAALGYDGIELAPFTVSDAPERLTDTAVAGLRRTAEAAGLKIAGLHWLLVKPDGLSLTSGDAPTRARTVAVMCRLVEICAALGGSYLVHGSPAQRRLPDGDDGLFAGYAEAAFAQAGTAALAAGVIYCVEPLARVETNYINTVAEAAALVRRIGCPALRTMVDTSAAGQTEAESPAALLERWLPSGLIAHVQVNDTNRRGPGEGQDRFRGVLASLRAAEYPGWIGVEPFVYQPDGPACAARAIGYLRGVEESLA